MNHWTNRRKASFFIHAYFVGIPFGLSTGAALAFWHDMFGMWMIAVMMVAAIEVLSLTGLVLHIARVDSPFVSLRHLLPFISIVPLGRELYLLLAHNDPLVAWSLTVTATLVLVVIAWQCFRTIERLFIDPVDAAREKAREKVSSFARELAALEEMNGIVDGFVRERLEYRNSGLAVDISRPQTPQTQTASALALPMRDAVAGHVYILRSEHGACKIGCTRELSTRINGIIASMPFAIEVVHTMKTDDMERLESGLHYAYGQAQRRINGEWFHLSENDTTFLISLGSEVAVDAIDSVVAQASSIAGATPLSSDIADTLETKKRLAVQMRTDRKSWREIANAVGRSPTTVREWLAVPALEESNE